MSNEAIVKYGGWTDDQVEHDEEQADKKTSDWHKWVEGDTRVRFLPSPVPGGKPIVAIHEHDVELPGGERRRFLCRKMMVDERCPGCEWMQALKRSKEKTERDLGDALYPRFKAFANIAVRKIDPKTGVILETEGPFKAQLGKKLFNKLVTLRKNPEYGDITDPSEHGVDITVNRKGTTMKDTVYDAVPCRKACGLGDLSIIDRCEDLSPMGIIPTYAEAEAAMKGEEAPTDGGGRQQQQQQRVTTPPRGRSVTDDLEQDKARVNQRSNVEVVASDPNDDIPF